MDSSYRQLLYSVADLNHGIEIPLGYAGEQEATTITIDMSEWLGNAVVSSVSILYKNPAGEVYPVTTSTIDRELITWNVSKADTYLPGVGEIQLVLNAVAVFSDEKISKSAVCKTRVLPSVDQNLGSAPDGYETWMNDLLNAAGEIKRVSAQANTLEAGEAATAAFDGSTGVLTIGIPAGNDGHTPARGTDYWNPDDVSAMHGYIEETVEAMDGTVIVHSPKYVKSVSEMTDTDRVYVLAETGKIWAYMNTTTEETRVIKDDIVGTTDNPYEVGRLSSGGANSGDVNTHVITPYIDLTKSEYKGKTIRLFLQGNRYVTENTETYIMCAFFDANKNVLLGRGYTCTADGSAFQNNPDVTLVEVSETSGVINIPIPQTYAGSEIAYMRFCGLGTIDASDVYIMYTEKYVVSGMQWVDTGTTYVPTITEADKQEIANEVAAMVDDQLLTMIGDGTVTA